MKPLNFHPTAGNESSYGMGERPAQRATSSEAHVAEGGISVVNKRSTERILVSGRAKAVHSSGAVANGKVVDVSQTGMCLLMEDRPTDKQMVTLDCNIFHNGRTHSFQLKAMAVYSILSSGRFKVGFQFEPNSPVAKKIVEQLAA